MKTRLLFLNQCFDKTRLRNLIAWVLFTKGEKETIKIVEKLKGLGFQFATRAGISLSIDDLKIPSEKAPLVSQAKQQVALATSQYDKGNVTSIEKLQQLVDTWHRTSETLKQTVVSNFQATDKLSPVYMMAFSGARGNISQVRQLAGMRGLMADPQGQIIGFPIRSNFREGLTLTEYMISCYGARKGLVDTALRTADAGYLTRRLVDVSQHMVVKASTCATRRGIVLYELAISGKSALSLRDRLVGRVLAQDVYALGGGAPQRPEEAIEERQEAVSSPRVMHLLGSGGTKVGERNQEISADLASQIASVQKRVSVRSPLTCSVRHGVCQLCYGWSLSEGRLVNLGEAVGIIAAQSIGEPGTQLTMRTFHTGGVFSGDVMTEIRAPYEGTAYFSNPLQGLLIRTSHGKIAFLTKSPGKIAIQAHINCKDNTLKGSSSIKLMKRKVAQPKLEETLFALEASTVVFVRQHEKVIQTQLIAEFSSMGIEINETIEAKRTLFANNAGQVSFASLLIGRRIGENGDIGRVSRGLGFVSILSGKQPGPVALLDLLQRGTHIVNQKTIVAKVASLTSVEPPLLGSKKKGNETALVTRQSPVRTVLLDSRTQRALVVGFESLVATKAVRRFLPSILYSWMRLTNDKSFTTNKFYLASSSQSTIEGWGFDGHPLHVRPSRGGQSLSRGNGNEKALPVLFRPMPLNKEAPALVIATSPIQEAKPPQLPAPPSSILLMMPSLPAMKGVAIETPLSASSTLNRSALCKQPYLSYSPLTVAHSLSINRAVRENTSVCIFPSQYQTPRNGLTWFDSRYLSRRLNLGELIWIETEAPFPYRGNTVATVSARPTSRITAVNPLAGQPSTYSKLDRSLDRSNVEQQTDGVSMATPSMAGGGQRTPFISSNDRIINYIDEREVGYFVTSTNFPNLFGKKRQGPFDCLVNKKAQQQTSSRAALDTSARLAHSGLQHKKVAATKSWIVTFEKSQSFSKQKALNLQRDYFFREPLINRRTNKATMSQGAEDHFFLFKDVGVHKRGRDSTEPIDRQQKNSHHWVYCPQQVQRVSTLHESINFYRNRQLDELAFDSSLVYTKALFTFELSYSVKNSLDCIAGKLLLSSERDTTFRHTSQVKTPPLVQTLQREMGHWRPGFLTADFTISNSAFQFRSHPFWASCQDVCTTRQYSSLYFNFPDLPGNLLLSNITNREIKPFAQSNRATSVSSSKVIEAFNTPSFINSIDDAIIASNERGGHRTPSSITSYYRVICVMKDIVKQCNNGFLLHFAGFKGATSFDAASKTSQFGLKIDETLGSESHTVGHIRPFAKGRALGLGFRSRPKSLDVFPQQRAQQMGGLDGHSQGSRGFVKKEGLLFLRKWMQVPQGYALHERTASFEKWDEALSLAKELKGPNSVDFVESGTQSIPSFNAIEGCTVKISALSDLKRGYKLSFDRRNCLQLPLEVEAPPKYKELGSIKIRSNTLETFDLQETGKTERYRFLVWKNLMNCKPFLLLRTCSLQMHVVSNTKARYFLPSSIEHPLTWHSLIHPLDLSREKLGWHKAESSNSLPVVSQVEAVQSNVIINEIDVEVLEYRRRQKGFLHQLSLRQQITLGPLSLDIDRRESFFDNLKKQEIGGQPQAESRVSGVWETPSISASSSNRINGQFCGDVNQSIAKVQQKRVSWPYSPKATLLTTMYKGSPIPLPSKTKLAINCTTQSDSVVTEGIRTLPRTGFANVLQRKIDESNPFTVGERGREGKASIWLNSRNHFLHFAKHFINRIDEHDSKMNNMGLPLPQLYTSLLRFGTKTRRTSLITNRKPNHLSLTSLLLTRNFCTKVVSNNSYLIRFLGTTTLSSTNQSSLTSHNTRDQSVSLKDRLSPAVGELVSQDFHHNGRYLGMSTSRGRGFDGPSNPPKVSDGKGLPFGVGVSMAPPSNTVLLTESDQISMSLSKQRANVSVGQFVTLGEEFVSRHATLVSGQVVAIEWDKITLRQTQALLFYAQGVTHVNHGQWVNKNAPILTLTYQKLVTGDIVQGIPKIEQFFEAPATRDGEPLPNSLQSRLRKTYNRLKMSLPQVQAVKYSLEEIQQVLVEGILRVYLSQGVRIADKHLEIVIRQMTSKGQILDVGNTGLFQGEFVNLDRIERINLGTYGQKAEYEPSVLGITQASLGAESFISAASFQETTRVLSRDTIVGKTDFLRGLKERVVLGDVIQAGTGLDDNINYGLLFGATET